MNKYVGEGENWLTNDCSNNVITKTFVGAAALQKRSGNDNKTREIVVYFCTPMHPRILAEHFCTPGFCTPGFQNLATSLLVPHGTQGLIGTGPSCTLTKFLAVQAAAIFLG